MSPSSSPTSPADNYVAEDESHDDNVNDNINIKDKEENGREDLSHDTVGLSRDIEIAGSQSPLISTSPTQLQHIIKTSHDDAKINENIFYLTSPSDKADDEESNKFIDNDLFSPGEVLAAEALNKAVDAARKVVAVTAGR